MEQNLEKSLEQSLEQSSEKRMAINVQRFISSSVCITKMLFEAANKRFDETTNLKEKSAITDYVATCDKIMNNIKNEALFNHTMFIKKAFRVIREPTNCTYIMNKNQELFNIRDSENKIITLLMGLDIKFGYRYFSDTEKSKFWQYMYLFVYCVYSLIVPSNPEIIKKYPEVKTLVDVLEKDIISSKILLDDGIFNAYLGIEKDDENVSMADLLNGENATMKDFSLASLMKTVGGIDLDQISKELENIDDEKMNEITDTISEMMGSKGDSDIKELCSGFLKEAQEKIKVKGFDNIEGTLMDIAKNAKNNINVSKLNKLKSGFKHFKKSGMEQLKKMNKDGTNPMANLNPDMLSKMGVPSHMFDMLKSQMDKMSVGEDDDV
jgi:hypothetical protein